MSRTGPTDEQLEDRFFESVKDSPRGLPYGKLVSTYATLVGRTTRTAKNHLKRLNEGIAAERVKSVARYQGPEGWLYGSPENEDYAKAKEGAELPHREEKGTTLGLGGIFRDSPVRSEWTHCPETNRIVRATVVTMGVADFMECPVCNWVHPLGVSPKMQDQRLRAWMVDPLVHFEDYADALAVTQMGDANTMKPQRSRIPRIGARKGHHIGLWFRSSWDRDPSSTYNIHGVRRPQDRRRTPSNRAKAKPRRKPETTRRAPRTDL